MTFNPLKSQANNRKIPYRRQPSRIKDRNKAKAIINQKSIISPTFDISYYIIKTGKKSSMIEKFYLVGAASRPLLTMGATYGAERDIMMVTGTRPVAVMGRWRRAYLGISRYGGMKDGGYGENGCGSTGKGI